jgi:uncharacterized SAM-binding protein YcdF (DUF218 family)
VSKARDAGPRRPRLALRVLGLVVAVGVVYVALTFVQVWGAARGSSPEPTGALVVLGAAQYNGEPSPALQRRLDHTAALYRRGVAPVIVVTGGQQPDDPSTNTEASTSSAYLRRQGVPASALRLETEGRTTWQSLAASTRLILRDEGITEVVVVSSPSHSFRIASIAEELGQQAHVSPAEDGALATGTRVRRLARETAAVSLGRLVGYRRLDDLTTGFARTPVRTSPR